MQGSEERLAAREAILEMREAAVAAKEAAADDSASNGPAESSPDTSTLADSQKASENGYAQTLACRTSKPLQDDAIFPKSCMPRGSS